jgi:uncharacterized protein involved in exopolysaccharide biosynthesis
MQIEFTSRGLLIGFFRQIRKFLVIFLTVVVTGVVYIIAATPAYEAAGSMLIKFGNDISTRMIQSEDGNPSIISQNDRREVMQSNVEILQSRSLILSVIKETGPEKIYPDLAERYTSNDALVEEVYKQLGKGDLTIKASQTSNVVTIKMQNPDPLITEWFVSRLMATFIERQSEIFNKPQTAFLKEQVKLSAEKLAGSQKALKAFKVEKGISSIEQELAELLRQKSDTGTVSLETIDNAWDRLSDLQSEETRLRSVYRADSPQVVRAHANVVLAKNLLRQRQSELKARTDSATDTIDKRIAALEDQRSTYNDLIHQVEIDEKNYKNYQIRSEEARVNETLNQQSITSVVVIDEPTVPNKPVHPRKTIILALCLLFGLVLGTGISLAFETFDQRFSSPTQVSALLGVPVMACFNADSCRST